MWTSTRPPAATASPTPTSSMPSSGSIVVEDVGEDPDRWLVIGPDRAANLLEVVVLVTVEGDDVIIQPMPLRAVYRKLLDP